MSCSHIPNFKRDTITYPCVQSNTFTTGHTSVQQQLMEYMRISFVSPSRHTVEKKNLKN